MRQTVFQNRIHLNTLCHRITMSTQSQDQMEIRTKWVICFSAAPKDTAERVWPSVWRQIHIEFSHLNFPKRSCDLYPVVQGYKHLFLMNGVCCWKVERVKIGKTVSVSYISQDGYCYGLWWFCWQGEKSDYSPRSLLALLLYCKCWYVLPQSVRVKALLSLSSSRLTPPARGEVFILRCSNEWERLKNSHF